MVPQPSRLSMATELSEHKLLHVRGDPPRTPSHATGALQGTTPCPDQRPRRDHSPGYAASLSRALLKILIRYASSDKESDYGATEEGRHETNTVQRQDSSSSAYPTGEGEEEEGSDKRRAGEEDVRASEATLPD
ncbi:hypothetical protein QAD02_000980 [Eretmocerus hayati]|uniref:Uncharacterized protein n=1 Tax=Eretmocerus hayati TaxID=131215 RepID=A0ACC2NFP9_9HYME|nr:hypothetical protein QAD02_000980 [Eretmocerus hayati]